jgi:polysaccharide biosynthesis/export protein
VLRKNLANLACSVLFFCLTTARTVATQAQQTPAISSSVSVPRATTEKGSGIGAENGQSPALQHRNPRYRLHPGDVLELNFTFTPEFNQTVTVQPDGYITLRGAEGIRVADQTIPEMTNSLRSAYGSILHDPVITVELRDFEKPYFIVGGEVGHPGKFELRGETTSAQAVAIAGGLRESAKHSQVLLFHRVPDGWVEVRKINLKKMLNEANLQEDAYLQPGDLLYVPKNRFSKIERFIPTSSMGVYASPALH